MTCSGLFYLLFFLVIFRLVSLCSESASRRAATITSRAARVCFSAIRRVMTALSLLARWRVLSASNSSSSIDSINMLNNTQHKEDRTPTFFNSSGIVCDSPFNLSLQCSQDEILIPFAYELACCIPRIQKITICGDRDNVSYLVPYYRSRSAALLHWHTPPATSAKCAT